MIRSATGKAQSGPLVTVLISTYNRPAYVAEALESIFSQTYPHFEIILTRDGGCPVRDVIGHFDDPRLTFIDRDDNRGLPRSFNEALSIAKGEYVCYLGDDDKFYPHHLETLVNAILKNPDYGAVYGDLYKVHCRVLPDGRRRVLSKNLEISRDYERLLMLQFNQALHVSLIHRRDIFERAGLYNENLNVLIDWDLTRKLCFYTDFLHIPVITGEYYAPVCDCDRISVVRRKDVSEYLRNVLTIRTTRPPKPWHKLEDLSVFVLAERLDEKLEQLLRDIWSHCFYPYRIFLPLTAPEQARFKSAVLNLVPVTVSAGDALPVRLSKMLAQSDAPLAAVLRVGITVPSGESMYIERALVPLMNQNRRDLAFEIPESDESHFGAAVFADTLAKVLPGSSSADIKNSLLAAGVEVRKPVYKEYPFQFDNLLSAAELCQLEGNWHKAAQIYDYMTEHFGNTLWMQTRRANALYQSGRLPQAAACVAEINRIRPTVATLLIAARTEKKLSRHRQAIDIYRQALAILQTKHCELQAPNLVPAQAGIRTTNSFEQPEETLVWT